MDDIVFTNTEIVNSVTFVPNTLRLGSGLAYTSSSATETFLVTTPPLFIVRMIIDTTAAVTIPLVNGVEFPYEVSFEKSTII